MILCSVGLVIDKRLTRGGSWLTRGNSRMAARMTAIRFTVESSVKQMRLKNRQHISMLCIVYVAYLECILDYFDDLQISYRIADAASAVSSLVSAAFTLICVALQYAFYILWR